jgi:Domain of unknown function (DUF1906)
MVDTDCKLTADLIARVRAAGYRGVGRYVPLPDNKATEDIDAPELAAILAGGLGVLLVQHVRLPGWNPAAHSGDADAHTALEFARTAGYALRSHIFLDLEGIAGTGADTKAFAEAWAAAIAAGGYSAGCYVGYDVPLNAQELYDLPTFDSYWSDAGPRAVARRGFAIKQQAEITIAGVPFDPDTIQVDGRGDTPLWTIAAPENIS